MTQNMDHVMTFPPVSRHFMPLRSKTFIRVPTLTQQTKL